MTCQSSFACPIKIFNKKPPFLNMVVITQMLVFLKPHMFLGPHCDDMAVPYPS